MKGAALRRPAERIKWRRVVVEEDGCIGMRVVKSEVTGNRLEEKKRNEPENSVWKAQGTASFEAAYERGEGEGSAGENRVGK